MKRTIFFACLIFVFLSAQAFAQADSAGICNCYDPWDTASFQKVPMTNGTDSAPAPNYYNNVNTSPAIKLPFSFCFYGKSYDTVYIGNKGEISFIKPIFDFTNGNLPAGTDTAMIAPFWTNINNIPFGTIPPAVRRIIWYQVYPTYMIVKWNTMGYYTFDDDLYDSFQLIISNGSDSVISGGNNVQFCYESGGMDWASADSSGGSMGFNGVPATVGINKGDKTSYAIISRPKLPGLTYYGPSSAINGLYWLEGKSLLLNTCVTDKNIAPVVINANKCDTFSACPFDSLHLSTQFLCAEQGQKATISATASGLGGFNLDTSSGANSIYTVNLALALGAASQGYHTVNVFAKDNSSPPQTSTYSFVVNVGVCTGINEIANNDTRFNVYPNANNGRFTIQFDNGQPTGNSEAKIYDILGKQVFSENISQSKTYVNVSNLAKGMYFLKVYRDDVQMGVKKIVIQ